MIRLELGNCLDVLPTLEDESVDAIVSDPPYSINFMQSAWDNTGIANNVEVWRECLRVLKPGGHLLAFGATRTYHRMACAIEDAGFEIRDSLHWIQGSGFPKSLDVSKAIDKKAGAKREVIGPNIRLGDKKAYKVNPTKQGAAWQNTSANKTNSMGDLTAPATPEAKQWDGWGTALKPSHEPIVLARKKLVGTVADNVLKHGTGAVNVDGCRVGNDTVKINTWDDGAKPFGGGAGHEYTGRESQGRWPPNILLSPEAAKEMDRQSGESVSAVRQGGPGGNKNCYSPGIGDGAVGGFTDTGGASRYFPIFRYCAKAGKEERNAGITGDAGEWSDGRKKKADYPSQRGKTKRTNAHPTVKPVDLMRWLCRLITPPGGIVLDPFMGSGTTGIACVIEGFSFIGIELNQDYLDLARDRIDHAGKQGDMFTPRQKVEVKTGIDYDPRQVDLTELLEVKK